ncbi:MAG TPA: radical SAM/SPASM family putative metalloenzyme maturase [Verrucomicrobiae bacterium]|nr:radical SAM/SPASM family putative metalloenzyme maturase [Verrucomicrobiae bacterium]
MKSATAADTGILPTPALREHPSRLYIEVTSRCNLSCAMCMKQGSGAGYLDGDLSPELFTALEPALPRLDALVLNGVGEPLLNRRLEQLIRAARSTLPPQAWIGFQSNGLLLTEARAGSLLIAGLDRICLSMDGVTPSTFRNLREGGELRDLERALEALTWGKRASGRKEVSVGIEFVLMRENMRELPAALEWAASRGVSFAIVSHLLPYDETHLAGCAYELCSMEALALFHVWKNKAELAGIDIGSYFSLLWKFERSREEQRIVDFVEAMKESAASRGITLDLKRLLALQPAGIEELAEVFLQANETARRVGIELHLPDPAPRQSRRCDFVEKGGAFVSWDGGVHPCYYLWHHCRSFAGGWMQPVQPKVFGDLAERGILEIWNDPAFRAYRENVLASDYPFCPGCTFAPCDYVQAESFTQDCYANREPCGSCLWSCGLFQCLS